MTKDEALKLALEALKQIDEAMPFPVAKLAQKAIREALAQPEQEPVATLWQHGETKRTRITMPNDITDCDARWFKAADLYTTPPQQQRCYCGNIYRLGVVHRESSFCDEHPRKPLTDEEIGRVAGDSLDAWSCARAIEAAHGIKGEA